MPFSNKKRNKMEGGILATNLKDQELAKKIAEYKVYEEEASALKEQYAVIVTTIQDVKRTLVTLEAIKGSKDGDETLVPLGTGILMPVHIDKTRKLIVGIGSGVSIESTVEEAIDKLNERLQTLERTQKNLEVALEKMASKIEEVGVEIEQMYLESQQKKGT